MKKYYERRRKGQNNYRRKHNQHHRKTMTKTFLTYQNKTKEQLQKPPNLKHKMKKHPQTVQRNHMSYPKHNNCLNLVQYEKQIQYLQHKRINHSLRHHYLQTIDLIFNKIHQIYITSLPPKVQTQIMKTKIEIDTKRQHLKLKHNYDKNTKHSKRKY